MSSLPKIFRQYLTVEGYSKVTIRNYLSDLNHFLAWLELRLRSQNLPFSQDEIENISLYFTRQAVDGYKNFLQKNNLPSSTVNRRLSTLRKLASFALSQNWIRQDPAKEIKNKALPEPDLKEIIVQFKKFLETEKTSLNTIKNYVSDVNNFLTWLKAGT